MELGYMVGRVMKQVLYWASLGRETNILKWMVTPVGYLAPRPAD